MSPFIPPVQLTKAEGAPARLQVVEDVVALTANLDGAVGNYARLCRFPTWAKVKGVRVFSDASLDANAAMTLAFDFGVTFSDATNDGTPVAHQGLIPTTVGIGGGATTPGTLTTFATQAGASAAIPYLWRRGSHLSKALVCADPVGCTFQFAGRPGRPYSNLSFFDIYVYIKTVAATPAAANLIAMIEYAE